MYAYLIRAGRLRNRDHAVPNLDTVPAVVRSHRVHRVLPTQADAQYLPPVLHDHRFRSRRAAGTQDAEQQPRRQQDTCRQKQIAQPEPCGAAFCLWCFAGIGHG